MMVLVVLLCAFGCINIWFFIYNCRYHSMIAEKSLELDKHEVSLDEREARNQEDIIALANMEKELKELSAVYCVSEADLLRYTTEDAIKRNARKHLAFIIANDITHSFDPKVSDDGKKYMYKFKIKQ